MEQALQARVNQKSTDKYLVDTRCTLTLTSTGLFSEISQPAYVPVLSNGTSGKSGQYRNGEQKFAVKPDPASKLPFDVKTGQSVAGLATHGANNIAADVATKSGEYALGATQSAGSPQVFLLEVTGSEAASVMLTANR